MNALDIHKRYMRLFDTIIDIDKGTVKLPDDKLKVLYTEYYKIQELMRNRKIFYDKKEVSLLDLSSNLHIEELALQCDLEFLKSSKIIYDQVKDDDVRVYKIRTMEKADKQLYKDDLDKNLNKVNRRVNNIAEIKDLLTNIILN
ncbi:hypothetical protein CHH57_02225 [Niallia circulans]|uniref:Uncharacterized protein n=1 Tax=Niallia circulans TaxID=1397 RepID=A0AA91TV75_NIACI|nr:hypothetical protein [Niallia circulans]PAD84868.1 hypothetical protein CHH57_02225 [Niallia circulans]